ncbi:MAG: hypothetical protein QXL16_00610 [Candidatus Micrarchaeaceae archaeon]
MLPSIIYLLSVLVLVFVFSMFDLFNRRNIPDVVVYAFLAYSIFLLFTYPKSSIEIGLIAGLIIGSIGYLLYKIGFIGAGDFFELMEINFMIPILDFSISGVYQLGMPFIISVFILTGYASFIGVPIYYVGIKRRIKKVSKESAITAFAMIFAYAAIYLLLLYRAKFSLVSFFVIAFLAIPSFVMILFKDTIAENMSERVSTKELEDGDIVAMDLISREEINHIRSIYPGFGRLVTKKSIEMLKDYEGTLPVYKHAVPFSFFIMIGTIAAILIGNPFLLFY